MITKSWSPEAADNLMVHLPPEERAKVVEYGAMLLLADLRPQLYYTQSKLKELTEKYKTSLDKIEREGLPEDANYEMHEDYVLWHHYTEQAERLQKKVAALEEGLEPRSG